MMRIVKPPEVQLATLAGAAPDGDGWVHEQKFDGYRIVAVRERAGAPVRLYTRRGNDWTARFPAIADAVAALPGGRLVLDGEVAAVGPDGITRFQLLQQSLGTRDPRLAYFVFDLLADDRRDLAPLPLVERKAVLAALLAGGPPSLRYSDHVVGNGARVFAGACERGLEGIVSKRADAPYTPGRGTAWLKVKCKLVQELVVGGFTDPRRTRTGIGALLVGYYEGGELRYAGKVGTGFTGAMLRALHATLVPLERETAPFAPAPARAHTGPNPHWVTPELVVEVAFAEWTADGRLRHPSFQGIREDKRPRDVVRELPAR